jgi:DNA topoisomerase-1
MTKLVIVESPAKTKTIGKFLPKEFRVESSVGHVRDLPGSKAEIPKSIRDKPWADYAVDVDNDFEPYYVVSRGKSKVIAALKKKLKDADELYVATDSDREGEAIGWHLVEVLKPKVPVKRMVFHEITKEAVQAALANTRDIDMNLVQAQETRRILDRLYGYTLSPLLWKKIGGNLSAGRVQSVALRVVVERERERRAFRKGSYWDLVAQLSKDTQGFEARLVELSGQPVATARDFDKDTGRLQEGSKAVVLEEERAKNLAGQLRSATWTVASVEAKERQSSPQPPFITSTLQQEANNRLNMSSRDTMRTAQRLYEAGHITYMRTDNPSLSEEGVKAARAAVESHFGAEFLHVSVRTFEHKKSKGAQEAHEAIRPAGTRFVPPDETGVTGAEKALYTLIWKRAVACQMANERYTSTTVGVTADEARFAATGKRTDFPGYRLAWPSSGEGDTQLPALAQGDVVDCESVDPQAHETQPPARYTEATLVRALEAAGVGRPSTYADILGKIREKGYVVLKGKALAPTLTAFAVIGLLEEHFPNLVDLDFTARMEERLDEIADGDLESVPYLTEFFLGDQGLQKTVEKRMAEIKPADAREIDLPGLPFALRIGRYGAFVEAEVDGQRVTASIPENTTPDELTPEFVAELVRRRAEGPEPLGDDPGTGQPIFLLTGRFGPYVQLGQTPEEKDAPKPKRSSIPRDMDAGNVSLDDAAFLLSLPRQLGPHPDGGRVFANIGRYGPYVAHAPAGDGSTEFRSLKGTQHLKDITLDEAVEMIRQPKPGRGARGAPRVMQDFGGHPDDGKPVQLLEGRYGPYVKHGKTNATVPKDVDAEKLTREDALELVAKKTARSR